MERILLYYPYTNIPDGNWLRNSLLYTDKVASILPYDMGNKRIPEETKILFDEGLYKPLYVSKELDTSHPDFEKFEMNFLETIQSEDFRKRNLNGQIYNTDENKNLENYVMYITKLTKRVEQHLRNNHLLRDTKNTNEVALEKNTALVYMSLLADYIARKSIKDRIIPSSDQREYESLAFQLADKKKLTYRIQLDSCLPTLLPNAEIKSIAKFKNKRKQELLEFRKMLDKIEEDMSLAVDDQERILRLVQFKETVEKQLIEIKKLLGDSKFQFVLNGFSSLLDFKQPAVLQQTGVIGGLVGVGVLVNLPLIALAAGSLILTGTLVSSFKKIERNVQAISSSYLYYAQQEGITA